MNILDWIIIIWLAISLITGIRFGLIYRLGRLIGLVAGIYIAGKYYGTIASWFGSSPWNKLIAFQFLLSGISMVGGFLAMFLNKIFGFISWIPFLKSANRILGGVFGVVSNALILSIALYFLSRVDIHPILTQTVAESKLAGALLILGNVVAVFLPKDITSLKSLF